VTASAVSPAAPPRALRPVLPRSGFRWAPRNRWWPRWLGVCPLGADNLAARRQTVQEQLAAARALVFPKGARP
jgi:hypothetical protein